MGLEPCCGHLDGSRTPNKIPSGSRFKARYMPSPSSPDDYGIQMLLAPKPRTSLFLHYAPLKCSHLSGGTQQPFNSDTHCCAGAALPELKCSQL